MLCFHSNVSLAMANGDYFPTSIPLLAVVAAENAPILLTGVLLSLVVIYLASKVGAEISQKVNLPPVLGELVVGVVVGIFALNAIVFEGSVLPANDSRIMVCCSGFITCLQH